MEKTTDKKKKNPTPKFRGRYFFHFVWIIIAPLVGYLALRYISFNDNGEANGYYAVAVLLFFMIYKVLYCSLYAIENIVSTFKYNLSFMKFLLRITGLMWLIIFSFACDYWCIYDYDFTSFSGLVGATEFEKVFDFIYFSVTIFTTIGGSIEPQTVVTKLMVVIEICTSFFMLIFLLANFNNIQSSIKESDSYSAPEDHVR